MQPSTEYQLSNEPEILFLPGLPQEMVETIHGGIMYQDWCALEAMRINRKDNRRKAKLFHSKDYKNRTVIGVKARCYQVVNGHKK